MFGLLRIQSMVQEATETITAVPGVKEDFANHKQRQMIAEHPFGTIKRWWDGSYFLTRGITSVSTETALT